MGIANATGEQQRAMGRGRRSCTVREGGREGGREDVLYSKGGREGGREEVLYSKGGREGGRRCCTVREGGREDVLYSKGGREGGGGAKESLERTSIDRCRSSSFMSLRIFFSI